MRTDEELMRAYAEGSEEAFNHLYAKYSPVVYGYVLRRLRHDEADDFFQKVWRQLHEKRTLYKDQPFAPWLFVLIRNLLVDEYRSLGRQHTRELKEDIMKALHRPEEQIDVDELLKTLSPESRDLVRRYYIDEVDYSDLEKETGLTSANLRQKMSRAMRALRRP